MSGPAQSKPVILIVDDDPDQLYLSRRLVEKARSDCGVVTVEGGSDAIALLEAAASNGMSDYPTVVLLDIKMPQRDGFEVLRWIRKRRKLARVKIIMLSSSDNSEDARRATELGADGYLIKYPHPAVLGCMLREVMAAAGIPRRPSKTADHGRSMVGA